jgi:hypothetical protein
MNLGRAPASRVKQFRSVTLSLSNLHNRGEAPSFRFLYCTACEENGVWAICEKPNLLQGNCSKLF